MSRLVGRGMLVTSHCIVRGRYVGDGVRMVFVCHVEQDSSRSVAIAKTPPSGSLATHPPHPRSPDLRAIYRLAGWWRSPLLPQR